MSSYVNKRAQGISDKVLKSLRLPEHFVEEVSQRTRKETEEDGELGNRFAFTGYNKGPLTRKAKRKMAKKEKKIKKQHHHLRKMGKVVPVSAGAQVGDKRKREEDDEIESDIEDEESIEEPPKKKVRFAAEQEEREFERDPPVVLNKKQKLEQKLKQENEFIKSLNKNEPESDEPSEEEDTSDFIKLYDRTRAEDDERDLRMLEKKLGLKKGRKIGDGLDDLLAGITSGGGTYKVKTNKTIIPTEKSTYDWEELLDYDSDGDGPQEVPRGGSVSSDEEDDENSQEFDEENFDDEDLPDDEQNFGEDGGEDEEDGEENENEMNGDADMDDDMDGEFNSEEMAAFDDENREMESDEESGEFDEENGQNDDSGMEGDENGDEEADEEDEGDSGADEENDEENGENSVSQQEQVTTNTKSNTDSLAGSTMKYIPPHLRRATEQNQAYKRELRGHVNRLADTNMIKTLESIEQLYSRHPRSEMNETLSEFILADCSDPTLLFTSNALLNYSALVASLHSLIGIEVGGHFIDKLAKRFNQFYKEKNTKLCKNLLIIFIHLYNLEIINASLLFDLTNIMIEHFNDEDIELLLVLVKHAGSKLRSDDPSSVKEMLVTMYTKASNYKKAKEDSKKKTPSTNNTEEEIEESKRVEFMLDMLMDLKNNKMRLVIDKEANIHLNNLKRTIKNYMKQRGKENIDEIRISWKDLTAEETKGRWWLIGSGWSRASSGVIGGAVEQDAPVNLNMNEYDAKLLEVAKKQRMNTDVRRAIFCIVMGSEDYLDAFEKLVRLGLKNKQERDIVFVIIHCCSMEKKFNPFYAHLAMKLCGYSHNFKFTFKFTFWDKFKDFENLQLRAISNLANLLAQLIGHHVLSLSILKVVSFESIEPKAIVFFKIFMVALMNDFEVEQVMAVFQRLASAPKTKQLKEGLDLFFMQIFTKAALSQITDEVQRKREDRAGKVAKMARKAMRDKQVSLF